MQSDVDANTMKASFVDRDGLAVFAFDDVGVYTGLLER
jgi:hypothetical protein